MEVKQEIIDLLINLIDLSGVGKVENFQADLCDGKLLWDLLTLAHVSSPPVLPNDDPISRLTTLFEITAPALSSQLSINLNGIITSTDLLSLVKLFFSVIAYGVISESTNEYFCPLSLRLADNDQQILTSILSCLLKSQNDDDIEFELTKIICKSEENSVSNDSYCFVHSYDCSTVSSSSLSMSPVASSPAIQKKALPVLKENEIRRLKRQLQILDDEKDMMINELELKEKKIIAQENEIHKLKQACNEFKCMEAIEMENNRLAQELSTLKRQDLELQRLKKEIACKDTALDEAKKLREEHVAYVSELECKLCKLDEYEVNMRYNETEKKRLEVLLRSADDRVKSLQDNYDSLCDRYNELLRKNRDNKQKNMIENFYDMHSTYELLSDSLYKNCGNEKIDPFMSDHVSPDARKCLTDLLEKICKTETGSVELENTEILSEQTEPIIKKGLSQSPALFQDLERKYLKERQKCEQLIGHLEKFETHYFEKKRILQQKVSSLAAELCSSKNECRLLQCRYTTANEENMRLTCSYERCTSELQSLKANYEYLQNGQIKLQEKNAALELENSSLRERLCYLEKELERGCRATTINDTFSSARSAFSENTTTDQCHSLNCTLFPPTSCTSTTIRSASAAVTDDIARDQLNELPLPANHIFIPEDEPFSLTRKETTEDYVRISEILKRNASYPPHLRSVYSIEEDIPNIPENVIRTGHHIPGEYVHTTDWKTHNTHTMDTLKRKTLRSLPRSSHRTTNYLRRIFANRKRASSLKL